MQIKFVSALATTLILSGCTTYALLNRTQPEQVTKAEIQLEDKVIAIGRPSQPIPNYPHVLVLAGLKNSYLVQPYPSAEDPLDLFEQIYKKINLNYIYLDPNNQISNNVSQGIKKHENTIKFDMGSYHKKNTLIQSKLSIYYFNTVKSTTKSDRNNLKDLDFNCQDIDYQNQKYLLCKRSISSTIQVASQVKNINNIQHRLKQPLNIQLISKKTSTNYSKVPLRALTPVTVAIDIVTSPIQGAALFLYTLAYAAGA